MRYYTIDAENNVTVHRSRKAARGTSDEVFSTEKQLADLIGRDDNRLLEIWNRLPGVKPLGKFVSPKVGMECIWKALQGFSGPPAPQGVVEIILDGYDDSVYLN